MNKKEIIWIIICELEYFLFNPCFCIFQRSTALLPFSKFSALYSLSSTNILLSLAKGFWCDTEVVQKYPVKILCAGKPAAECDLFYRQRRIF